MAKKLNVRVRCQARPGKLLMYAEQVHQNNKRRIKNGLISLIVIPFILVGILLLTDSSRIVFLIIWIACMFVVAAFLLYIAYSDWMLQSTINELSRDELGEVQCILLCVDKLPADSVVCLKGAYDLIADVNFKSQHACARVIGRYGDLYA